jgi:hypothetical protein
MNKLFALFCLLNILLFNSGCSNSSTSQEISRNLLEVYDVNSIKYNCTLEENRYWIIHIKSLLNKNNEPFTLNEVFDMYEKLGNKLYYQYPYHAGLIRNYIAVIKEQINRSNIIVEMFNDLINKSTKENIKKDIEDKLKIVQELNKYSIDPPRKYHD